jgi:methionine aminotransferase
MIPNSKLPLVGTTIFTVMSALANEHKAINLSQGFPDFPLDERFKEILSSTLEQNVHQYAPMMGLPALREEICKLVFQQHQRVVNVDEVLVTAGATQAIFTSIQALVNAGDEVIIIDPAYDCYGPAVDLVQAKRIHIPLTQDLTLDLENIKNALNDKTRMLIINNPHNPTGAVFSTQQLKDLIEILSAFPNCLILSDEVYEFINFTNDTITFHQFEAIQDRLITVSSFGKTLHITGWKLGYMIAPEHLMHEIKKVHQFLVFSVNHFAQYAIADFLKIYRVEEISPLFLRKRNLLQELLKPSKFELLPCRGTYFQLVDYSRISTKNDVEFSQWLTKEVGVASIPISVFFKDAFNKKYLRLCFAKSDKILTSAAERLCKI